MSKVTESVDFDRVADDQLKKFLSKFGDQLLTVINGGLDFQSNFSCKLLSVTFSAANTNTSVSHGLGRVPTGYIPYQKSASLNVYDGTSANSASTLNLRASATGTVGLIVF